MTELRLLTSKHLRDAIKHGDTPEVLQERYSCTEEELKEKIRLLYKQEKQAQEVFNSLKANRKKPQRKLKDIAAQPTPPVEEIEVVTPSPRQEKTLVDLMQEERTLSREVINLENQHKALAQKRRPHLGNLRKLQDRIKGIEASLKACHDEYQQSVEQANAIAEQMNDISAIRRDKVAKLEAVRQEIEIKSTISIYVYEDGRIEASDNPEFIINDDGYLDLKSGLSEREECLDLRVRDIVTLARLLKISEKVEKLTLICENETIETAFQALRPQMPL